MTREGPLAARKQAAGSSSSLLLAVLMLFALLGQTEASASEWALDLRKAKSNREAIVILEREISARAQETLDPTQTRELAQLHELLSYAYYAIGEYALSTRDAEKAIELNPKNHEAYRSLGNSQLALGQYSEAISSYGRAIEINRYFMGAIINRAQAYGIIGRLDEAISDLDELVSLYPYNEQPVIARAWIHFRAENTAKSIEDSEAAVELGKWDVARKVMLGQAYHYGGRVEDAKTVLQEVLDEFWKRRQYPDKYRDAIWPLIWLRVVDEDADVQRFLDQADHLEIARWPAPMWWLYQGRIVPSEVMRSVPLDLLESQSLSRCYLHLYVSLVLRIRRDFLGSNEHLKKAVSEENTWPRCAWMAERELQSR